MVTAGARENDPNEALRERMYGVVDIGSNTVHLLVARTGGSTLTPMIDISDPLYLGTDVDGAGAIGVRKLDALIETLLRFRETASQAGVEHLQLVATQAVRAATNREEIMRAVTEATGLPLEILGTEDEAALAFLGACTAQPGAGPRAMLDIGGGSAQIAVGARGQTWGSVSLPLGAARMAAEFLPGDPPTDAEANALVQHLAQVVPPVLPLLDTALSGLLGVGGTLRRLSPLLGVKAGEVFPPDWLARILILVGGKSANEVASTYNVTTEQARLILPATLLLAEVARGYQDPPLVVVEYGLREGAILSRGR